MAGPTPAIDVSLVTGHDVWRVIHPHHDSRAASALVHLRKSHRGFTLIEGLLASIVLAVAVLGIVMSLSASYQASKNLQEAGIATSLSRQLLEEIASRPYLDPTTQLIAPAGNGNRASYTSLGQYQNYTDQSDSITMLNGTSVPATASGIYTRTISIDWRDDPDGTSPAANNDMALVTVTITAPSGRVFTISKLFTAAALTS